MAGSSGALDEANYSTFEMRQSRRSTLKSQRGTMRSVASRKSTAHGGGTGTMGNGGGTGTMGNGSASTQNFAMINGARAPPRPAPSLVRYSDEDDSAKGYDENPDDSDSLTEKPSEISSTDSQVFLVALIKKAHLLLLLLLLSSYSFSRVLKVSRNRRAILTPTPLSIITPT